MKEVERMNATIADLQQQQVEFVPRYNPYTIKMDRRGNCSNCGKLGHITKYYRNQGFIAQERRVEYRDNHNMDNSKDKENLVVLDQVLIIIRLQYSIVE